MLLLLDARRHAACPPPPAQQVWRCGEVRHASKACLWTRRNVVHARTTHNAPHDALIPPNMPPPHTNCPQPHAACAAGCMRVHGWPSQHPGAPCKLPVVAPRAAHSPLGTLVGKAATTSSYSARASSPAAGPFRSSTTCSHACTSWMSSWPPLLRSCRTCACACWHGPAEWEHAPSCRAVVLSMVTVAKWNAPPQTQYTAACQCRLGEVIANSPDPAGRLQAHVP